MFQKTLSLLLALVLFLSGGACTSAMAMVVISSANSSQTDEESTPASVAAFGGNLYILNTDGALLRMPLATRVKEEIGKCLYTGYCASAGDVAARRETDNENLPAIGHLFVWEGRLYGFCAATGNWVRLLDDTGAVSAAPMEPTLDTSGLILAEDEENRSTLSPTVLFAQEEKLYYAATGYASTGMVNRIGQIDLTTGEGKLFQTRNLIELAPWTDGKLMARYFDEASMYNAQDGSLANAQYGLFDPAADSFTVLGEIKTDGNLGGYMTAGLCAQPETGTLYYTSGGRVMGLDVNTGEKRVSAYTGAGMFSRASDAQILLADGYYISKSYEGVKVYALDTEAVKQGALRIFGEFGSDAHSSFLRAYPDIPVDVGENYTSSLEELTASMVSGSDAYDVLLLNMSYMPVARMREKGYCMELSQYPQIMGIVEQMYPKFVEPLKVDGKLFAVPVQMSAYTLGVNKEAWTEELGLSEEELPKTYVEFLDFIANWEDDYGDEHGDLRLLNAEPLREILFSSFFQDYITYMQSTGEDLRFDTPVMRGLLTAYESIDFPGRTDSTTTAVEYAWDTVSLFDTYHTVGQFSASWQKTEVLCLPLAPDAQAVLGTNLSVLIINPKTTRLEQALLYVTHYLEHLNPVAENITFFPEHNDPLEESYYARNLAETRSELEKQKGLLEAADESEKPSVQERIRTLEERLAEIEKTRYSVTAEDIAAYRENEYPLLFVNQMSAFLESDTTDLSKTLMQYLDGAISQDQFLKEMDQRVRLMELEAK